MANDALNGGLILTVPDLYNNKIIYYTKVYKTINVHVSKMPLGNTIVARNVNYESLSFC